MERAYLPIMIQNILYTFFGENSTAGDSPAYASGWAKGRDGRKKAPSGRMNA
jgi:hypothetical protein